MSEAAVEPLLQIEDVKRLDVKAGDVLLVTVPNHTTALLAEQIKERFASYLPGVKVIIVTSDIAVQVVAS